jgi:integrase
MANTVNLTDAYAAKAEPSDRIYWDTHKDAPKGFGLRVTAGSRAWVLNYRVKSTGRERRLTVGDVSAWKIADARKRAAKLRRDIDEGGDPLGEAQDQRAAPTVDDLIERYIKDELPSRAPSTQREYRDLIRDYIKPALGPKKVTAIEQSDIKKLHRQITVDGKNRRANSVQQLVHVLFKNAIDWEMRGDNPATGVKPNLEVPRERYLTDDEMVRLNAAFDRWRATKPDAVDVLVLLLLTGSRRGEVLNMTWSQLENLDTDKAIWTKPALTTKQRRTHRVPLSDPAVAILRRRQADRDQGRVVRLRDDRVFRIPGDAASRLKYIWQAIRREVGIQDVRIHDLRHSYASFLVNSGLSLPVIGKLLGHASVKTTERYAHLYDDTLRAATSLVGRKIGGGKT